MARAHRVSLIATIVTIVYLLLFFQVFPVPLLDAKIAEQILPVVRNCSTLKSSILMLSVHSTHTQLCPYLYVWPNYLLGSSPGGFLLRLDHIVYGPLEWVLLV